MQFSVISLIQHEHIVCMKEQCSRICYSTYLTTLNFVEQIGNGLFDAAWAFNINWRGLIKVKNYVFDLNEFTSVPARFGSQNIF